MSPSWLCFLASCYIGPYRLLSFQVPWVLFPFVVNPDVLLSFSLPPCQLSNMIFGFLSPCNLVVLFLVHFSCLHLSHGSLSTRCRDVSMNKCVAVYLSPCIYIYICLCFFPCLYFLYISLPVYKSPGVSVSCSMSLPGWAVSPSSTCPLV
jgi:hypothetical protein